MKRIRIAGARLIDPESRLDRTGDVCIAEGRIVALGETPEGFSEELLIDGAGKVACPGLIDLCARLGEPGGGQRANIASEAWAAAAAGITTLVCPPDTEPVADAPAVVEFVHRRAQEAAAARVLPLGAMTRAQEGERLAEMAALRAAGCPAVGDGGKPIRDSLVLRRALDYAATLELPAILTPADPWLLGAGCVHEGGVATRRGLAGIPDAAESAGLGRLLAVAADVGAAVHVGRLSAAVGLPILDYYRRQRLPLTADVAIHQLFFSEQDAIDYNPRFHLAPPLRTVGDRSALRGAVSRGDIDIICSDHTPLNADAKDGPFEATRPGASGIDTLLALLLRLVEEEVMDLPRALATATSAPAALLGLDAGRLDVDRPADLCVFDPEALWWCEPETLRSRGANSPFQGWELSGRVTHTLVGGRLVYRSDPAP